MNLTDEIIDYENGDLTGNEILQLFSKLIKSGIVWDLQGSYGRMASALIDKKYLSPEGEILTEVE